MIQDKAGRRASSTVSEENRFFDLMVASFENAASHKYVVQKSKSLSRVDQKGLDIHFLFLSKNHIKSWLKIEIPNFCRLVNLQTLPGF